LIVTLRMGAHLRASTNGLLRDRGESVREVAGCQRQSKTSIRRPRYDQTFRMMPKPPFRSWTWERSFTPHAKLRTEQRVVTGGSDLDRACAQRLQCGSFVMAGLILVAVLFASPARAQESGPKDVRCGTAPETVRDGRFKLDVGEVQLRNGKGCVRDLVDSGL